MGQVLHGSATTTRAIRAAIQRSKAPLKELAAGWADSTRAGQPVQAPQPSHVRAVGMQAIGGPAGRTNPSHEYNPNEPRDEHGRWTTGGATASPGHQAAQSPQSISYGSLSAPAPSSPELAQLRRQQAAFAAVRNKLDIENSWFAAPALAAPLAVLGLEGAAALAARGALPAIEHAPGLLIGGEAPGVLIATSGAISRLVGPVAAFGVRPVAGFGVCFRGRAERWGNRSLRVCDSQVSLTPNDATWGAGG
jgi:hypothetical protein